MARLGRDERRFCLHHGIPLDRLFDAEGYKRAEYKKIMPVEEAWAAYGVTTCLNGHTLRSRHGTCLMCNLQVVAHLLRSKLPGHLYVATGKQGTVMKLGFSQDPSNRISIANDEGWGGLKDWRLYAYGWSATGGKVEAELHRRFEHTRIMLQWVRNGTPTFTRESYLADLPSACSALVWLCDHPIEFRP